MPLIIQVFEKALHRFHSILQKDLRSDDAYLDASIQRFEFCYELCWKTLKRGLQVDGIVAKSPREVFEEAFKLGLLGPQDDLWTDMIEDRNATPHTYDEETAEEIYSHLSRYETAFQEVLTKMKRRWGDSP